MSVVASNGHFHLMRRMTEIFEACAARRARVGVGGVVVWLRDRGLEMSATSSSTLLQYPPRTGALTISDSHGIGLGVAGKRSFSTLRVPLRALFPDPGEPGQDRAKAPLHIVAEGTAGCFPQGGLKGQNSNPAKVQGIENSWWGGFRIEASLVPIVSHLGFIRHSFSSAIFPNNCPLWITRLLQ